jgi:hypothetical protein
MIKIDSVSKKMYVEVSRDDGEDLTATQAREHVEKYVDTNYAFCDVDRVNYNKVIVIYEKA